MTDGLLSLSWNNHKATFCHILSTLREKERYTDVTLACEGKFYPTHKLVLSTCSEYFEKMFENTPCKHPVILLGKDVKCDELEALLSYMYDGVVSVAQNDLARLIKAAELLQIKGLAVPDEPPQTKKNYSWSSRDDRTSPHPKRRRREESNSACIAPLISSEKAATPPSSPPHQEADQSWEQTNTTEVPTAEDSISQRLEFTTKQEADTVQNQENSEETLVKEEVVETIDDSQNEDPGMDYSSHTGSDSAAGGDEHSNKYSQHLDPKQSQPLHEAVVEALAGPSGMQGWLGTGDMGGGFPMLESYTEEGNQETQPAPIAGTQQAHQMVWPRNVNQMAAQVEALCSGKILNRPTKEPKKHLCPCCSYSTNNQTHLLEHYRTHTGEKPFSCPHCTYKTGNKCNLKRHVVLIHSTKNYQCPHCSYRGCNGVDFAKHLQNHG